MARTGLIFAEEGFFHDTGPRHPECPERLAAIRDAFATAGLDLPRIPALRASHADLARNHSEDHIATMRGVCMAGGGYSDPDTVMMEGSWEAALFAAGSAIAACQAVLDGAYDNVFSACRPPGHHAERDFAMGFCLFNNVAIAAKWLREVAGMNRVAILDWDVHHGNGTQHSTFRDPTIYYVSLHEYPHYPGTGRAEERGENNTNLNIPMRAHTPAEVWLEAIEKTVVPELERFSPDFLLISCGFDAHEKDPLAHQELKTEHYADMTRMVRGLANGRIVSLLEGGYNLDALGASAVAHVKALGE